MYTMKIDEAKNIIERSKIRENLERLTVISNNWELRNGRDTVITLINCAIADLAQILKNHN